MGKTRTFPSNSVRADVARAALARDLFDQALAQSGLEMPWRRRRHVKEKLMKRGKRAERSGP
jgi:hypothetical protein